MGATLADMPHVAYWMAQAITGARQADDIASEVREFMAGLGPVRFTWED
jgi:hypothetical protein